MRISYNGIQIIAVILFGAGCSFIAYQIKTNKPSMPWNAAKPTPTIFWQEEALMLNEQEKATMSGNFEAELQKNLASPQTPGEPTPMWRDNIPASAAGDLIAPTVTINGGPAEGVTTTQTAACFPLWVSDNRTPWQQLMSRAQLDTNQWSSWMNYFSYCFDNLGNGDHTVTIQVKDLAGNISANAQRRFSVKR